MSFVYSLSFFLTVSASSATLGVSLSVCVYDSCVAEESMAASLTQSPLKSFSKNRTLAHIPKRKQCVMLVVSARSLQRSLWEVVIDRAFPSDRRVFAISVLEAHPDLFWHYLCKRDGTLTFYLSMRRCSPSYTHRGRTHAVTVPNTSNLTDAHSHSRPALHTDYNPAMTCRSKSRHSTFISFLWFFIGNE